MSATLLAAVPSAPQPAPRLLLALVEAATLAPSSHNAQPWRFRLRGQTLNVYADLSRRLPVADPDDHELYISLGCAIENVVLAARAFDYDARVSYATFSARKPASSQVLAAIVDLVDARRDSGDVALFAAIERRQTTRCAYAELPIATRDLRALERSIGDCGGTTQVRFLQDESERRILEPLVTAATRQQFGDPAFRRELARWIRFSGRTASAPDGMTAASLGVPGAPDWLGRFMLERVIGTERQARANVRLLRRTPLLAVCSTTRRDAQGWMELGRAFQRFALCATALDLRHSHLNMVCEVPSVRVSLKRLLGLPEGAEPLLAIRVGKGPTMPRTRRRQVPAVLDR